jgi:hypothetical protein
MFFAAVMRREFQRDTGASEKFQAWILLTSAPLQTRVLNCVGEFA